MLMEASSSSAHHFLFLFVFYFCSLFDLSLAQKSPSAAFTLAPAPAPDIGCNGIHLTYTLNNRQKIRPFVDNPAEQPYSFNATATVINSWTTDLVAWDLLIGFRHDELIVGVDGAVLTNSSTYPYNTTGENVTSFTGYPNTDLMFPIETANNLDEISAKIKIIGTLFGAPSPAIPLPAILSVDDPTFLCPKPSHIANTSYMSTCCVPNPNFANETMNTTKPVDKFLPRRAGDLTISYDVLQAYPSSYLALVTMENHSPLGRLDHWHLSWEWARGEFIYSMRGAHPTVVDVSGCIFGAAGQYYQSLDYSQVLTCSKTPVIIDLPRERYNDSQIGLINHCCRNGTILPAEMDPSQSISAFQMQVFKLPPDVNRTTIYPPKNFKISGELNPDYQCGQPLRVTPTTFPDPSGLDSDSFAIATWQIVCNISKSAKPKCCVSYSAFYNDSVVPCSTCACGCPSPHKGAAACNATAPALLLPPQGLLVPFDNRTTQSLAWADIKHYNVPKPMPCADNCGVSINWHINTDYRTGWSARITLFNWDKINFADWFVAVKMEKAYDGYQQMYSFNGTAMGNDTIFMQGMPGLNYLIGLSNDTIAGDPLVPGKVQSVMSFTKKVTPGIDIVKGDGFPTKVYFNGEECALPNLIPTSGGGSGVSSYGAIGVLATSTMLMLISSMLLLEL